MEKANVLLAPLKGGRIAKDPVLKDQKKSISAPANYPSFLWHLQHTSTLHLMEMCVFIPLYFKITQY